MRNLLCSQVFQSTTDCKTNSVNLITKERGNIPSFISKTYEILQKEQHSDLISWSENGLSFYVINIKQFQENILPMYFRHKNFASFVRQLNMYDFHKVRGEQKHIFSHKLFQRHQRNLLGQIKRKCFKKNKDMSDDENSEESKEIKVEKVKIKKQQPKEQEIIENSKTQQRTRQKKRETIKIQKTKKTIEMIERQQQRSKERNLKLMDEVITKLMKLHPKTDKQIRERINQIKNDPKYHVLVGKWYIYNIYKTLKENLFEFRPKNTVQDLEELSIQVDILYNQIQKPSRFQVASLAHFQTQNFLNNKSDKQVLRTITGQPQSRDFF